MKLHSEMLMANNDVSVYGNNINFLELLFNLFDLNFFVFETKNEKVKRVCRIKYEKLERPLN